MSNYNVGDLIRLTRQSIGMSQEELSDGICSVQTLSRIENGKVNVKKDTYQKLMERMGRNGQKNYSVLALDEFELLDIMFKLNTALFRKEYKFAEECVNILKKSLDMSNDINKQYIFRTESNINYALKKISSEEYIEKMEEIIALSIPDYKELFDVKYPFKDEEVQMLMNVAARYSDLQQKEMAITIYFMLIRSLNSGYMKYDDAIQLIVILTCGLAKAYGGLGKHESAIQMCKNAIKKAKQNKLFSILPNAYAEMAWNMVQQTENGQREKCDLELCKKYLRQGYAAAALSKQTVIKNVIESYYKEIFNEAIW